MNQVDDDGMGMAAAAGDIYGGFGGGDSFGESFGTAEAKDTGSSGGFDAKQGAKGAK
jgi:hypothetical protein